VQVLDEDDELVARSDRPEHAVAVAVLGVLKQRFDAFLERLRVSVTVQS
jgi:hypothetical protein